jgi:hypothetical protein
LSLKLKFNYQVIGGIMLLAVNFECLITTIQTT